MFNRLEGAHKRNARRWMKYGNGGEGSSSGGSSRPPWPPVYDSSDEEELIPVREPTFSAGDYVHGFDEEDAAVA
jgi:hypothetical protein